MSKFRFLAATTDGSSAIILGVPPQVRILIAGVLFSLGGALIKLCTFPPLERAGLRAGIAALTVMALLPEARRLPGRRAMLLFPAYFAATVLFVLANAYTTAANAIFLLSSAPFWIAILSPLLVRERAGRSEWIALGCIAVGMSLFFVAGTEGSATAPDPRLGDWLALASGLSYGLLLIGFRWLAHAGRDEQGSAVAWCSALTAPIAIALSFAIGEQPTLGDPTSWMAITALGTLQVGLSYALLARAMPFVPAVQASVLLMIEPALNPVLTFFVHGEQPAGLAILGGVLIIGAVTTETIIRGRVNRRRSRQVEPTPRDRRSC